jgi:hypothetical protein
MGNVVCLENDVTECWGSVVFDENDVIMTAFHSGPWTSWCPSTLEALTRPGR